MTKRPSGNWTPTRASDFKTSSCQQKGRQNRYPLPGRHGGRTAGRCLRRAAVLTSDRTTTWRHAARARAQPMPDGLRDRARPDSLAQAVDRDPRAGEPVPQTNVGGRLNLPFAIQRAVAQPGHAASRVDAAPGRTGQGPDLRGTGRHPLVESRGPAGGTTRPWPCPGTTPARPPGPDPTCSSTPGGKCAAPWRRRCWSPTAWSRRSLTPGKKGCAAPDGGGGASPGGAAPSPRLLELRALDQLAAVFQRRLCDQFLPLVRLTQDPVVLIRRLDQHLVR